MSHIREKILSQDVMQLPEFSCLVPPSVRKRIMPQNAALTN